MPQGVQGTTRGVPSVRSPRFSGWKPSASLIGEIAANTFSSDIWSGKGDWTRIAFTDLSEFSVWTRASSSRSVVLVGSRMVSESIPISRAVLAFPVTYETDAGSSPIMMTLNLGVIPFSFNARTSLFVSLRMIPEITFPSIIAPMQECNRFQDFILPLRPDDVNPMDLF